MKLIKFIAAIALVASTSLVSGANSSSAGTDVTKDIAIICPVWPHCRDVEFADQTTDQQQQMKTAIVLKAA